MSTTRSRIWAGRRRRFPRPSEFSDYRKLLDKANTFDAVSVSTPDHMHAPIALAAMALGKHVFCQKPLTHTVHEARLMREAAKKHNLVTQMGNQIQSHHAYRTAVQLVHDGAIGKVREVHSWQAGDMRWMLADDAADGSRSRAGVVEMGSMAGRGAGAAVSRRTCITRSTGGRGRISARANWATSAATFSTRCSWRSS